MRTRRVSLCASFAAVATTLVCIFGSADLQSASEDVRITIPAAVSFAVTNVSVATAGSPASGSVSFNQLNVVTGHVLKVSVKADSDFVPPSGAAIPASKVSWTTSGATNGTGSNGTLSTSTYSQLFLSGATKKSGSVNVTWSLAAPGTGIRAGIHRLTVRWKLESF